jgi:hypothetical protein
MLSPCSGLTHKSHPNLPDTNTLAYFAAASVPNKKRFLTLTPGLLQHSKAAVLSGINIYRKMIISEID